MTNVKTTSNLLNDAATLMRASTDSVTGLHVNCEVAIIKAATLYKYRKEVAQRALREFRTLFGTDVGVAKKGRKLAQEPVFGKLFSETRDRFAVKNVLKNRDQRITALVRAAEATNLPAKMWPSKRV